jgi:RNA polymerase sigma-70 factor (ECF subfamily)
MQRDLVLRAMAGEHEAFSELARLSIDRLFAVARLILRDSQRAEDATQEALVAAWRDLSALRDPDRFEAWLRQLLVRACYREARRDQQRMRREARVAPLEGSVPDPAHGLAERDQLERGFARLDPEQRALVVVHFYLGLPMPEAAELLGFPLGTAKSRLHRAIQAMRAGLDADARLPQVEGTA